MLNNSGDNHTTALFGQWVHCNFTEYTKLKRSVSIPGSVDVDTMRRLHATSTAVTTLTPTHSTLYPIEADTDVSTASPGETETNSHGVNLQVIFFNIIIIAGVIGIAIVIVIYIYRIRKGSDSPFLLDIITLKIYVFAS